MGGQYQSRPPQLIALPAAPAIKARLAEQGSILGGSPAAFGRLIADETEKWAKVIKFANIKPE